MRSRETAPSQLTHVDRSGHARMVDVAGKDVTVRTATASGIFRTTAHAVELLQQAALPKGDALAVARIAGITAAKRTWELIPLCHPIPLHGITVTLEPADCQVRITATARTADRTGVEMEALTAVAIAGLTLHDMVKAVDPAAELGEIHLDRKEGGRSGIWTRSDDGPAESSDTRPAAPGGPPPGHRS